AGRYLVAVDSRIHVGAPVGLPFQIEAEWYAFAPQRPVRLGRIVEGDAEAFEADTHVFERGFDDVARPEPVVADVDALRVTGYGRIMVDDRHEWSVRSHHTGPVPASLQIRQDSDA